MNGNQLEYEIIDYARYGEIEELTQVIESNHRININFQDNFGITALHMASANGFYDCVKLLVSKGSKHLPNKNGNYPLNWAIQNKHKYIIKLLLHSYNDIDVLIQNEFGKSALTEAFKTEDSDIITFILEHKSATEERLVGKDLNNYNESVVSDDGESLIDIETEPETDNDNDININNLNLNNLTIKEKKDKKIIQETELNFKFNDNLPILKIREIALDSSINVFDKNADEDSTGITVWAASLILSQWILHKKNNFNNKKICELGSGCGVSGLTTFLYTNASHVVLSDLFYHTTENLKYNVEMNLNNLNNNSNNQSYCDYCNKSSLETDNKINNKNDSITNNSIKLMICSGCKMKEYCSKSCQLKSWKNHKLECKELGKKINILNDIKSNKKKIDVLSIDWDNKETWPNYKNYFDILIGSDLIYHEKLVPILVNIIKYLIVLKNGTFMYISSQSRNSIVEFKELMEKNGFLCQMEIVPDSYKINTLVGKSNDFFDLHFNEMDDTYCKYIFTR